MKKIFSISLVLLLMFSTMSFTLLASNEALVNEDSSEMFINEDSEECEDRSFIVMHQASNAIPDLTIGELTQIMNIAYALCEGYTMEEIVAAN
ncbi:hypothetical protein [Kordia sp.]|uniref:hypothetical protein n=1 Tax=Kordia sp. TaxID=1965332 RepID=UPI003D6B169A